MRKKRTCSSSAMLDAALSRRELAAERCDAARCCSKQAAPCGRAMLVLPRRRPPPRCCGGFAGAESCTCSCLRFDRELVLLHESEV